MSKEALGLLIDLRLDPSEREQASQALFYHRLLHSNKTDCFSLTLLGTSQTEHHLDGEQFIHLRTLYQQDGTLY